MYMLPNQLCSAMRGGFRKQSALIKHNVVMPKLYTSTINNNYAHGTMVRRGEVSRTFGLKTATKVIG